MASVNENRRFPPPWVVAGGVVAALVLLFLLGFAYGQRPDWHIGEWHWGNIFTVLLLSDSTDVAQYISKIIAALAKEQKIFMNLGIPETPRVPMKVSEYSGAQ